MKTYTVVVHYDPAETPYEHLTKVFVDIDNELTSMYRDIYLTLPCPGCYHPECPHPLWGSK